MTTTTAKDKDQENLTAGQPTNARRRKSQTTELSVRRATGPRTVRGKMKSRYNAIKHGIFARVVLRGEVLKESKSEYLNLLQSFRESLEPVGGLEEFLVEKLAQLAWRKARAVRAEAAVVMKQTDFLRAKRDAWARSGASGASVDLARVTTGTLSARENSYLMQKSLELLDMLRGAIRSRGFDSKVDEGLLETLYGNSGSREGIFLHYRVYSKEGRETEQEAEPSLGTAEELKQLFLKELDQEIEKVRRLAREQAARQDQELELEEESLAVPETEQLDRLLRYEARLDGAFDRTLTQLERLQRMRLGQPNLPPVKVELS